MRKGQVTKEKMKSAILILVMVILLFFQGVPIIALAQQGIPELSPCRIKHDIEGCIENMPYDSETTNCTKWKEGQEECKSEMCCLLDSLYTIIDWTFFILLVTAIIFILLSSIEFVTSGGDPDKVKKAKRKFLYTLVGIVLALLCKTLPALVIGTLLPENGSLPPSSQLLDPTTFYIIDSQGDSDGFLSLIGDYGEAAQATEEMVAQETSAAEDIIRRTVEEKQGEQSSKRVNYRCPDFNKDGVIQALDIVEITKRLGTSPANPEGPSQKYDPIYDLNRDEKIDNSDLTIICYYFSQSASEYYSIFPSCVFNQPYQPKQVFLISDENWQDVLSLVPVSTHDGERYPVLIYHREGENAFDADSILYFFEQYKPSRIMAILPDDQNLSEELIKGINELEISIGYTPPLFLLSLRDYLEFFPGYTQVVYVDNNYTEMLLASSYASFINEPLVIKDTFLDKPETFQGKTKIYAETLKDWQLKILDTIGRTDKIILVNPNDLTIKVSETFFPKKSLEIIDALYSKTSLIAPFLAATKKELILPVEEKGHKEVDKKLKEQILELGLSPVYLTIIASPGGIEMSIPESPIPQLGATEVDNTVYGNIDGDIFTELAVGRIFGITSSDFSSYVARDLFYQDLNSSNNFAMFVTNDYFLQKIMAKANDRFLAKTGFNRESIYEDEGGVFTASDFLNKFYVDYEGHGQWNKLDNGRITALDLRGLRLLSVFFVSGACSTCDYSKAEKKGELFCANLLRAGALANLAAITRSTIYLEPSEIILEQMGGAMSIGLAFKNFKNWKHITYFLTTPSGALFFPLELKDNPELKAFEGTFILLGDPTVNLDLSYPYAPAETVETEIKDLSLGWRTLINSAEGYFQQFYVVEPTEISGVQLYLKESEIESGNILAEITNTEMATLASGTFKLDKELPPDWYRINFSNPVVLEPNKYFLKVTPGYLIGEQFIPKELNAQWAFLKTPDAIDPNFYEFHSYLFKINEDIKFDITEPFEHKLAIITIPKTARNLSFKAGDGTQKNDALMYEAYPGKELSFSQKQIVFPLEGNAQSYLNQALYVLPNPLAEIKVKDIIRVEYVNPTKGINFPLPPWKLVKDNKDFVYRATETPLSFIKDYGVYPALFAISAFKDSERYIGLWEGLDDIVTPAEWPSDPLPSYQYKIYLEIE